ncbi:TPA: DUF2971 domain-containing protein [Vibrio parahaemolyticus]|nr:DUF2971 domain-containing protein [Vibrio parahaemolyticus]
MFKFREINKTTYEIFLNSELWCASPTSLNDPFDAQFDYQIFGEKVSLLLGDQQYANALAQNVKGIFENFGICSFSRSKDNQVMWAHYADEHKGLCIEFDITKVVEENSGLSLAHVNYQSELPELKLVEDRTNSSAGAISVTGAINQDIFKKILATKDVTWSYEEETRIIKPEYGVIKFSPKCVLSISFGLRTSAKDITNVKRLLSGGAYAHVKWFREKKSMVNYSLDFEEIEI